MADTVEQAGLRPVVLPDLVTTRDLAAAADSQRFGAKGLTDDAERRGAETIGVTSEDFGGNFIGVLGLHFGEKLLEHLERPDLIVREATEFGGYYAAEKWGIPNAVVDISPMAPFGDVLDEINAGRRHFGLDPVDDPWQPMSAFRPELCPRPSTRTARGWIPRTTTGFPTATPSGSTPPSPISRTARWCWQASGPTRR